MLVVELSIAGGKSGKSGSVGPQWRSDGESEMKGALDTKCNAVGEGPNTVDEGCKAADGGNVFADARVVEVGHEAVVGDKVLASSDAVDEGRSTIEEGRDAVGGDHDSDNGDERVKEWGIALPNKRGDETECPCLRLGL